MSDTGDICVTNTSIHLIAAPVSHRSRAYIELHAYLCPRHNAATPQTLPPASTTLERAAFSSCQADTTACCWSSSRVLLPSPLLMHAVHGRAHRQHCNNPDASNINQLHVTPSYQPTPTHMLNTPQTTNISSPLPPQQPSAQAINQPISPPSDIPPTTTLRGSPQAVAVLGPCAGCDATLSSNQVVKAMSRLYISAQAVPCSCWLFLVGVGVGA